MLSLLPSFENLEFIFRTCRKYASVRQALRMLTRLDQCGLAVQSSSGKHLVSLLSEARNVPKEVEQIFNDLESERECSWNSLVTRYARAQYPEIQKVDSVQLAEDAFLVLLKECTLLRDLEQGIKLHKLIAREGLIERNVFVGSSLVGMYAKCGEFVKAEEIFHELPVHDVVSWNILISGYAEHGHSKHALRCFQEMRLAGISFNAVSFVYILKACGSIGMKLEGQELHAEIVRMGLECDSVVGNSLVDMYAKCGMFTTAKHVLYQLPSRDTISWNTLLARYADHDFGQEALDVYNEMQREGLYLNRITFICILKACSSRCNLIICQDIHVEIVKRGLESELVLGSTLIDMYSKFGLPETARCLFDKLSTHDIVSWTALLSGFGVYGHSKDVLQCLEQMQEDGIILNCISLVCSLKACCNARDIQKGQVIHVSITKLGLETEVLIGNTLVDLYAKCGCLMIAEECFCKLPSQDTVSFNALISGYAEYGHGDEAFWYYEQMLCKGIYANAVTYFSLLKACASTKGIGKGQEIHFELIIRGVEIEKLNSNMLINMYGQCGLLEEAQMLFSNIVCRDINTWNALIEGFVDRGCYHHALVCFKQMHNESCSPNAFTLVCILRISINMRFFEKSKEIHLDITKIGLEYEYLVANTLIDMYSKYGLFATAWKILENFSARDVVSWTALLAGFVHCERGEDAVHCFNAMQSDGVTSNAITLICVLKIIDLMKIASNGQALHAEITKKGLEKDITVGNTLIDMYARCGLIDTAQKVFDRLPIHDIVSWNVLLSSYAENACDEDILCCLDQLQNEGIHQNIITYVCALKACGNIGTILKGQEIHSAIAKNGLEEEHLVCNALIDMYAKCGLLIEAQYVFQGLEDPDVISWNAMIAGYSQLGSSENVFFSFNSMILNNIQPNPVTFLSILNACNHTGLVDIGQIFFNAIRDVYGFVQTVGHFACMIDILGRAGHIERASDLITRMPLHPGIIIWHSMLGACRKWGDVEHGRDAFDHALCLYENSTAAYSCMFNIYADATTKSALKQ